MSKRKVGILTGLMLVCGMFPASADDVTGEDRILCTVNYATRCMPDGECIGGPPVDTNIPRFIEGLRERGVKVPMEVFGDL